MTGKQRDEFPPVRLKWRNNVIWITIISHATGIKSILPIRYHFSRVRVKIVGEYNANYQQIQMCGTVVFVVINEYHVRNITIYLQLWRTVYALTSVLSWRSFPSLFRDSGNKHQNNILVSALTFATPVHTCYLTHLPMNKMAAISQTTFWNAL